MNMMNIPETLQYSATRTLIIHPLYMKHAMKRRHRYLGGITVPKDILRAVAVNDNHPSDNKDDLDMGMIMELFTQKFVHSRILIFPSLTWSSSPTPHQLDIHLKRWGETLMELSMVGVRCGHSADELWEIIGNNCSSRLLCY